VGRHRVDELKRWVQMQRRALAGRYRFDEKREVFWHHQPREPMPALMVQGASSSAGKSLITAALARAFRRRGIDVVPFKAQNMSNNARVVKGGEIGTAQYLQALAARVEPEVRMNPVLVKPEGDDRSQVVILGRPDLAVSRLPWRSRSERLWPIIEHALRSLLAEHELLLLEGAGSPAEINLRDTDLANMRSAMAAGARVILVADIDRGGAFAHLYGTWALLPSEERDLLAGFVLNKFRGDPALLPPAPEQLEKLTGVPTLGVVPWLEHGLPDEDGAATPRRLPHRKSVAVVRYPTASNLDEFKLLEQVADVSWVVRPEEVEGADLLVLPGSKHVAADLSWLARTGLAEAVRKRAQGGQPVLGICGGLQMLGQRIEDGGGVDGSGEGLGLLPLETTFAAAKRAELTSARFRPLLEPWAALGGKTICGYQIRHGRTTTTASLAEALPDGLGFVDGAVLGIYVHGLFEQPEVVAAYFGEPLSRPLDEAFNQLADAIEEHLDIPALLQKVGIR
jgi:adenosylcobyric acid synthase